MANDLMTAFYIVRGGFKMAIRWGIVSTGRHPDLKVVPAMKLAEDTKVDAVYSREMEYAEAFAVKHDIPNAYNSIDDLLHDPGVDAVYIASPNFLHAQYTLKAAEAGKHILVEKPMAVTVAEAVDMVRACRKKGEAGCRIPSSSSSRTQEGTAVDSGRNLREYLHGSGTVVFGDQESARTAGQDRSDRMVGKTGSDRRRFDPDGHGYACHGLAPLSGRAAHRRSGRDHRWADFEAAFRAGRRHFAPLRGWGDWHDLLRSAYA